MMELPLEKSGQEMNVAESSCKDITKIQYVSVDIESSIEYVDKPTPIQNFYDGQGVFLFDTLRKKQLTFQNRIVIGGDSNLPNLGISVIDKATLNEKIKLTAAIDVQVTATFRESVQRRVNNTHVNVLIGITADVLIELMPTHHGDNSVKLDLEI
ncbi:fatty acyl-CoA reductase wat-like [Vespula squamosa]|uniref:Fatty acyl-CoA reductase wat-like n=1 Tax=Vespula squamosa TaxID=30214 RepID=A0ABD2BG20_VESSQ